MSKRQKIQVHRMDDWFSGIYLKAFGTGISSKHTYEASEPHRHDFYYCILVNEGSLEMEVDFQSVQLNDGTLFLSYPGQIHRIVSANLVRGWFLAFDPAILVEQLKSVLDQRISDVIVVPLNSERSAELYSFIGHLYTVYNNPLQLFSHDTAQSMITAFVYQVASAYLSLERTDLSKHSTRSVEITKTFKQMLRQHFKSMKRPSEYAAQMNMTVTHLNDTVRTVTGFPVTYYIQQELMREAKRLLCYADLSVKEIAEELGFGDEKYFNRLFSKVIGTSPGAFRNKMQ